MIKLTHLACVAALALAPGLALAADSTDVGALRFIGAVTVPNDATVDGTLVGGLSGIDYDAKTGLWSIISDDKSDKAPARFYVGALTYGSNAFTAIDLKKAVTFRQGDGTAYPNAKAGGVVPDPEALRVDPETGNIWWTSEGDRKLGLSPFLNIVTPEGRAVASVPMPDLFQVHKDQELGARHNLTFEGLSFAPDAKSVWVGMESALYQDGPIATVEAGTMARIIHIGRAGEMLAEYAYPVDPIQAKPAGKNGDNGVSEILALDDHRLLVLERSGVEGADGVWKMYIRLYEADTTGATDVSGINALAGAAYQPMKKRLVLDFSKLPELGHVDNLEGMSFGPTLPDGNRSLVFVSDNNFNDSQITQFLAFEAEPGKE